MGGILLKIRSWWEVADRTQRVVTIFGSAFLVLILGGTFYFASKPKMAMAYGGLTPGDQGRVVAEVQKLGIPVEIDMMGTVNVPHDKIALVHSTLAKNGVNPTSGHLGNADRGTIGIMSPKSVEEAQLNAIREGEIAQTLESLNGVSAVKVLLTTGDKSAFAGEDNPPTASVTITEEGGADLSGAPAKAMASLVARAVPGLTTKNVSIVNQDGLALYDGSEAEGSSASYANKISGQVNEARRIKRELQPLLDRFGPGNTVLTVRVEMDFDKATERKEDVKAGTDPLYKESADETMSGGATGGATPSGSAANGGSPGIPDGAKASGSSYTTKQKKAEFPYTKTNTETERAPGTVTKISISVLANSKNITDVNPIKKALEGYLGSTNVKDKNFEVSVTPAEFDVSQEKVMKDAAGAASSKQTMQQVMSLLPIGALVLVAMMIIKSIAKVAKSHTISVAAYPSGQLVAAGVGSLPQGSYDDDGAMSYASSSGEGEIAALEPPRPKKKKKKMSPEEEDEWEDDEPMHVRIGRINEKVNVPLEQIKKMTKEKPEAVAMLLKSWLVEERR